MNNPDEKKPLNSPRKKTRTRLLSIGQRPFLRNGPDRKAMPPRPTPLSILVAGFARVRVAIGCAPTPASPATFESRVFFTIKTLNSVVPRPVVRGRLSAESWLNRRFVVMTLVASGLVAGCGTMKSHIATEQLLISDAIERAVEQLDFGPLENSKVYLDTQYMRKVTAQGFLNSDYIRSAIRQRLMLSNCELSESKTDAEYVVEVRVGALGTDAHEINYGIPASQPLSATAAIFAGAPVIPTLPEVSLAKKDARRGAAKLYVFAYRRETMEPVWQPEVAYGRSSARSMWVLGAGPFEKGTIYNQTQFAGAPIEELEVKSLPSVISFRDGVRESRDALFTGLLPLGSGLADLIPTHSDDALLASSPTVDASIDDGHPSMTSDAEILPVSATTEAHNEKASPSDADAQEPPIPSAMINEDSQDRVADTTTKDAA